MPRPDTHRQAGRGPLGSAGTAGSPDNNRIPVKTPGPTGLNDAAVSAVLGERVGGNPNPVLRPIWLQLTATERDCVRQHSGMWKDLVEGKIGQALYSSYARYFDSTGAMLCGNEQITLAHETPLTIIDRVYSKLCLYEYGKIDGELKKAFEDQSVSHKIVPAWRYYRALRAGYVQQGITYPYRVINQIDPHVKFLGKPVWKGLHKDLIALLARVEKRIYTNGTSKQVLARLKNKHWGGFVPRFIAGKQTISKHAIGLAIDLDYPTNPHIKGEVAKAIDAVLDHLQTKGTRVNGRIRELFKYYGNVSMSDYDRLKEISDVLVVFMREWIPKWESLKKLLAREKNLKRTSMPEEEWKSVIDERDHRLKDRQAYAVVERLIKAWGGPELSKTHCQHGLVTLDGALFRAMKAEGVSSGIEWDRHKDVMHFELPMSLKQWSKKKGHTQPTN